MEGDDDGAGVSEVQRLLALCWTPTVTFGEAATDRELVLSMLLSTLLRLERFSVGSVSSSSPSMALFKDDKQGGGISSTYIRFWSLLLLELVAFGLFMLPLLLLLLRILLRLQQLLLQRFLWRFMLLRSRRAYCLSSSLHLFQVSVGAIFGCFCYCYFCRRKCPRAQN